MIPTSTVGSPHRGCLAQPGTNPNKVWVVPSQGVEGLPFG